jgi:hypothetical protein
MYAARYREGLVLLMGGLHLAEANGFATSELRARLNISFLQLADDPSQSFATARAGLDRARRLGLPDWATLLAGNAAASAFALGEWGTATSLNEEITGDLTTLWSEAAELIGIPIAIRAFRGETEGIESDLERFDGSLAVATASQEQGILNEIHMFVELAAGRYDAVLGRDLSAIEPLYRLQCQVIQGHAAAWTGDLQRARAILEGTANGAHGRWGSAMRQATAAGIAALEGRADAADHGHREAMEALRGVSAQRDVALVAMDRLSVAADERSWRAAAYEARTIWTQLGATAMLARLEELVASRAERVLPARAPNEVRAAIEA